jgi:hypothetical protein
MNPPQVKTPYPLLIPKLLRVLTRRKVTTKLTHLVSARAAAHGAATGTAANMTISITPRRANSREEKRPLRRRNVNAPLAPLSLPRLPLLVSRKSGSASANVYGEMIITRASATLSI